MSKIKVQLKIQAFELSIDADREDLPRITQALSNQIAGTLLPRNAIGDSSRAEVAVEHEQPMRRARPKRAGRVEGDAASQDILWKHDPERWGSPKQGWSTQDKSIWLLHVAAEGTNCTEMTSAEIARSFNAQFREAGQLRTQNVKRDLGKAKQARLVAQDATSPKQGWYLTNAGKERAVVLIAESQGQAIANGTH